MGRLPWYANEGYSSKGKKWTTNDAFVIGIAFIGFNCVIDQPHKTPYLMQGLIQSLQPFQKGLSKNGA